MFQDSYKRQPVEQQPAPGSSNKVAWVSFYIVLGVVIIALLLPLFQQARETGGPVMSIHNLKQLGLAMHYHHDDHHAFPPGGFVLTEKKPFHSWMTMLLPYTYYSRDFESIILDIPWDDPANATQMQRRYSYFLNPGINKYQNNAGYGISHYSVNDKLFFDDSKVRIEDITDGTEHTIMGGEIASNFPAWGDPANRRDITLGINTSPNSFGNPNKQGALILFADGMVRLINEEIDPKILNALSTPDGGEEIDPAKF